MVVGQNKKLQCGGCTIITNRRHAFLCLAVGIHDQCSYQLVIKSLNRPLLVRMYFMIMLNLWIIIVFLKSNTKLSDVITSLQIVECRRVLKWTYAYGYYLSEDEHAKRQFFEYLQGLWFLQNFYQIKLRKFISEYRLQVRRRLV